MIFLQAWDALKADGRLWAYEWTVKADPDAVLLPDRLRDHLRPITSHEGRCVYILNCNRYAPSFLLYGAVEVYSKKAVGAYFHGEEICKKFHWQGWGEDYFMQTCLDRLGVGSVGDYS